VWFARAVQTLQGVVDRDDRLTTARAFLENTRWGRASALGKLSRYAEAADDWHSSFEASGNCGPATVRLLWGHWGV
jgi:hypothetical protein